MILPNRKTSKTALYILTVLTLTYSLVFYVISGQTYEVSDYGVKLTTGQLNAPQTIIMGAPSTVTVKSTAFSSGECHTTWCRNNPEVVGHQVALNAKYGHVDQVYIPEFDRTYDVIGTTDEKTDLDIYYGTNYQGAKEYGVQYVEVQFL